jgi:hypothetical protein
MKNNEELQIGKEVICIDAYDRHFNNKVLTLGKIYIIHGIVQGCTHSGMLIMVQPNIINEYTECITCGHKHFTEGNKMWFRATRFRLLDPLEALMDKLESEPQQVEESLTIAQ